ncbi:MAG TPA: choice-of-anchor D domain-containing protein, partial [Candidatus Cloacimonadota bacterium]|nr:choice-of-anchor D domain-containing protein [Candidatus Cloacimonadota bacterium]
MKKIALFVLSLALMLGVFSGLTAQTLLWTEDFGATAPTGWTVVNAGSGNNWSLTGTGSPYNGSYNMQYQYHSTNAANTWAFTPGIAMTAGNDYYLTFYQRVRSSTYPENLKVTVGNAQTVASQTTTLLTLASVTNTTYAQRTTAYYRPTTSGTYYFAFNCYSAANMWNLYVDYVQAYAIIASPLFTITPSATSHSFGDVLIGDYLTQEYVISNSGGGGSVNLTTPFAVTGDSYFSIARQPLNTSLAPGDTTSFVVKYAPTILGSNSGSLTITYGLAKATHTISFSGRGVTTPVTMFEEDWESGSDGWTIVNGTQTNKWHLGTATYSSASHSMYISNNSGASNAYTTTSASVVHVYRDIAFTEGVDGFDFEFDFKGYGEA